MAHKCLHEKKRQAKLPPTLTFVTTFKVWLKKEIETSVNPTQLVQGQQSAWYEQIKLRAPRRGIPYQRRMLDNNGMLAQTYCHGTHIPHKTAGMKGIMLIYTYRIHNRAREAKDYTWRINANNICIIGICAII